MQVYFVLQKELLQVGILELDTLFPFLSTLDLHNIAMTVQLLRTHSLLGYSASCYNPYLQSDWSSMHYAHVLFLPVEVEL